MKSTIWIFSLEPIETRYTAQWHSHVPALLKNKLGDRFNVVQVDGVQKNSQLTPGAFLNFSDTNYWKSAQMCAFLEQHNQGKTGPDDHFIFTDAWNPTVIQLKYMSDLLGFNWTIHGLWHAGSYDPQDFLGRIIGDAKWVRHAECSFFEAINHNYFATDFHIQLWSDCFLLPEAKKSLIMSKKIVKTGWPMEYLKDTLVTYSNLEKENIILFPHRIAPEKQLDIFRDLAEALPEYKFVIAQDQHLSKHEYHTLLGKSKIVFSANLQETLGISCFEALCVNAFPLVPNRLSYTEMYPSAFKYDSRWSDSFNSYLQFKDRLVEHIRTIMTEMDGSLHFEKIIQTRELMHHNFFSATNLLENIT